MHLGLGINTQLVTPTNLALTRYGHDATTHSHCFALVPQNPWHGPPGLFTSSRLLQIISEWSWKVLEERLITL
jgi:hypothetical protein